MKWIKVNPPAGSNDFIIKVKAGGKTLCLIRNQGKLVATQIRCPHAGGDLSQGWCKNGKLICAIHRYEYDLSTGKGSPGQGDYINTYPVEVRDDGIYVGIKDKWAFVKNIFKL